ncbi:DUF882 domain-containing protein [Pendulispora rubella]|uniref:DUF882 domain-containing protein n=1 Tax=Pendulispora rubella TaxID=2741070 RepID=A0ABZ2L9V6_9BACT
MKALSALGALSTCAAVILGSIGAHAAPPTTKNAGKSDAKPAAKAPAPAQAPAAAAVHKPHGKTALSSNRAVPGRTLEEGAAKERAGAKSNPPTIRAPKVKPPCFHDSVTVMHFAEEDTFPLTKCDGSVAHLAVERLSVLARPGSAPKPQVDPTELANAKGDKIATGIRRIDPKLVERIQTIVDHFSKGKHARLQVISGYRPASAGSYHATGRALDMRLDGVSNEALVAFCKTLPDTGCGYYPNSSFIHIDVRQPGTGHVGWIDASGPGESPRYVGAWPPPKSSSPNALPDEATATLTLKEALAKLDSMLPPLPVDEHSDHDGKGGEEAPAKEDEPTKTAEKKTDGIRFQH